MLTYYMSKYPLKCAPDEIAGAHFSGYLDMSDDRWCFDFFFDTFPGPKESLEHRNILVPTLEKIVFYTAIGQRPTLYKAAFFQSPPYSSLYTLSRQCCEIDL